MSAIRIRPATPLEASSAADLCSRVFAAQDSYYDHLRAYNRMLRDPGHRPEMIRLLELDGRVVAHALIVDRTIRGGRGELRAGGIGWVATIPEFRRKGLARRLMDDCLTFIQREGYHISMLAGIPDFYHRFGYSVIMPGYKFKVETRSGLQLAEEFDLLVRSAPELCEWKPKIVELYEAEVKRTVGAAVRSEPYWEWLFQDGGSFLLATEGDHLLAYAWLERGPGKLQVHEVAGGNVAAVTTIVRRLADLASGEMQQQIDIPAHPGSPFGRALAIGVGGEACFRFNRNAGWMGRILDLQRTVAQMLSGVSLRQVDGPLEVVFSTELGLCHVQAAGDGLKVSALPDGTFSDSLEIQIGQNRLLQLLFGLLQPRDLLHLPDYDGQKEVAEILERIIPARNALIFPKDSF